MEMTITGRRKFTAAELAEIITKHGKWRRGEAEGARAYLAGADLTDANLAGADLTDADLTDANLAGADLTDADLTDADLAGADLTDADLTDADLAGADLTDANLAGADLTGAKNLPSGFERKDPPEPYVRRSDTPENRIARAQRYRERHPEIPVVENLDARILQAVESGAGKLEMGSWHACATTHCRAGWAVHLAGDAGYKLEREYGPRIAGAMIYRASTGRAPHFFASNEDAMADIKACAGDQPFTTGVQP